MLLWKSIRDVLKTFLVKRTHSEIEEPRSYKDSSGQVLCVDSSDVKVVDEARKLDLRLHYFSRYRTLYDFQSFVIRMILWSGGDRQGNKLSNDIIMLNNVLDYVSFFYFRWVKNRVDTHIKLKY
jgi:hypothetical protein